MLAHSGELWQMSERIKTGSNLCLKVCYDMLLVSYSDIVVHYLVIVVSGKLRVCK